MGAGQVQIQTITSDTTTDRTFYWITDDEATDYDMESAGWFDADNWMPVESVAFAVGEGFLLSNDFGEGAKITYAGQVATGATVIPLASNYSVCGNATPVAIDILSIVVEGEGVTAGSVQIQTTTSDTTTDRTFYWIPTSEAEDYEMEGEGWFDADNWVPLAPEEVVFAAGEGFLVSNDFGEGASMKLPACL